MKIRVRNALALVLAVTAGWVAYRLVPKPLPELSRSELLAEVREGHISKVTIEDGVITGVSSKRGPFRTAMKDGDRNLPSELRSQGVKVVFERSNPVTDF